MEKKTRQLMIWESEVTTSQDGKVRVDAKKPVTRLSVGQAAKILGCGKWTVTEIFREGLISGWKPGAKRTRSDGKASNAAIKLDAESVLNYPKLAPA